MNGRRAGAIPPYRTRLTGRLILSERARRNPRRALATSGGRARRSGARRIVKTWRMRIRVGTFHLRAAARRAGFAVGFSEIADARSNLTSIRLSLPSLATCRERLRIRREQQHESGEQSALHEYLHFGKHAEIDQRRFKGGSNAAVSLCN